MSNNTKYEKVQISQLRYGPDVVFYAADPREHNHDVLPEYMNLTNRGGWEWVWVVYWGEKNPYLKPTEPPILPPGSALAGLINPLESDWF